MLCYGEEVRVLLRVGSRVPYSGSRAKRATGPIESYTFLGCLEGVQLRPRAVARSAKRATGPDES